MKWWYLLLLPSLLVIIYAAFAWYKHRKDKVKLTDEDLEDIAADEFRVMHGNGKQKVGS